MHITGNISGFDLLEREMKKNKKKRGERDRREREKRGERIRIFLIF